MSSEHTTPTDDATDHEQFRQCSLPELVAELRATESQIHSAGQGPDGESFTPLIRLAFRELQIVRELRRRKLLAAVNR
jgi:hypothetical protein